MSNLSAVLHGPHDLRIDDREIPVPERDEVVIKVADVGICGSDVHYFEHGRIGDHVVTEPMVIGHEAAGTIVAVGAGVAAGRVGERVALEPGVPCRQCTSCLSGHYNLCPGVRFFATPPVDGAITQYVALAAAFAHPVPADLPFEHAAMAEPVSVGLWACRRSGVGPGDRVLVTGAGPIGLLSAQVARAFGAEQITVTDVSPYRLDVARALGLHAQPATAPLTGEYDVVLECSGAPAAFRSGFAATARAGRIVLVGMGSTEVGVDVPMLQGREITLTGTFRYAGTYPLAISMITNGTVDVAAVITHRFGIDQTADALTLARREPESLKAVVHL